MTSSPGVSSNVDFSNRILSLDFNTTKHGSVQILLRRAISSYLDRRAIVQTTVGAINPSIAPGGSHLLAQGQPGYVGPAANGPLSAAKVSANAAEVAGAHTRAALQIERAGYHRNGSIWVSATGVPLAMEMLVPLDDHWAGEVGAIVKDQLSASGITVKVVGVSNSTVVAQTLRTSRAQLGIIVRPSDPFPAHGASWFTRSPTGPTSGLWAGYQSRALNLLAAQASQDLNPADAQPLYQAIDAKLWTAMPSLPIFTEPAILEWSTVIDGVMLNPFPPGTLSGLLSWKIVNPSP
jgi:ABC-type transport system substrate-binding protein